MPPAHILAFQPCQPPYVKHCPIRFPFIFQIVQEVCHVDVRIIPKREMSHAAELAVGFVQGSLVLLLGVTLQFEWGVLVRLVEEELVHRYVVRPVEVVDHTTEVTDTNVAHPGEY